MQSARLVGADRVQTGLAKSTVKKVCMMMKELGVPDKLLATKDICDTYENVRNLYYHISLIFAPLMFTDPT